MYLCGAVATPGVYAVPDGTRMYEVIELAGGLTEEAATDYINQARVVEDGEQIVIPTAAEVEDGLRDMEHFAGETVPRDVLVNINTADVTALCTVPGVGASRAASIIAYREAHGSFCSIEDLKKVSGIKDGIFEKMKEFIKVS